MDFMNIFNEQIFPVACVLAMGWFLYNVYQDMKKTASTREERYISLLNSSNDMLNKCQETNAKFIEQLENMQSSIKTITSDIENIKEILNENE